MAPRRRALVQRCVPPPPRADQATLVLGRFLGGGGAAPCWGWRAPGGALVSSFARAGSVRGMGHHGALACLLPCLSRAGLRARLPGAAQSDRRPPRAGRGVAGAQRPPLLPAPCLLVSRPAGGGRFLFLSRRAPSSGGGGSLWCRPFARGGRGGGGPVAARALARNVPTGARRGRWWRTFSPRLGLTGWGSVRDVFAALTASASPCLPPLGARVAWRTPFLSPEAVPAHGAWDAWS